MAAGHAYVATPLDPLPAGRMPHCMNPADRFTPELRTIFKEVDVPKHLGKSIYWMGPAPSIGRAEMVCWLESHSEKLKAQLEWFPTNNSKCARTLAPKASCVAF